MDRFFSDDFCSAFKSIARYFEKKKLSRNRKSRDSNIFENEPLTPRYTVPLTDNFVNRFIPA